MIVRVTEDAKRDLAEYARVSIAFEVREIFDLSRVGQRYVLTPRAIDHPYVKDYGADGGPATWPSRFDLTYWHILVARAEGSRVGGAVVVVGAPDVELLGGDEGGALLWDLRVAPNARGRGVGTALVAAAEATSAGHGARWLDVETQNVNVPACRFYEAREFRLRAADPHAYPSLPDEIQLMWRKPIGG